MFASSVARIGAAGAFAVAALAYPLAGESSLSSTPRAMPIVIASDGDMSPCDSLGQVTHLDPHGDNFLSVQSGPGGKPYTQTDRLLPRAHVHICGEHGMWWAVVYGNTDDDDCRLARPRQKTYTYRGPCRFGWVSKHYVTIIAG